MSKVIQQRKQYKILLIGEICKDVYVFGSVNRLNPEAPVPILKKIRKESKHGMAGNVFKNIEKMLGCEAKINFYSNDHEDIKKIRFIDKKSNYQIMRYDIENNVENLDFTKIEKLRYDAVIISDYNKGFLTSNTITKLVETFKSCKIFVDTKRKDLSIFKNCVIKVNEREFKESYSSPESAEILVTLGDEGCLYKEKTYSTKKVDVHDVCGAGDVFLAALVVRWLETKDMNRSIKTANNCAALSVTKLGCYTVSRGEYENLCI